MKATLYLSDKSRERDLGEALKAGFEKHGEAVEVIPTQDYTQPKGDTQIAVMVGVKGQSKKIFEDHRRSARHTLLVDKSYFGRGEYHRLSLDGFQPKYAHQVTHPAERLEKLGVEIKPKRKKGAHVIYAGSSQKYCDWHDLGDATQFAGSTCFAIGKHLRDDRSIYYRPKPSWVAGHPEQVKPIDRTRFSGPNESLASILPNCHALVTHGSNAAIEAIAAGVPAVLCSREGAAAAWPLAEHQLENINDPFFPDDDLRRRVFANLAWCQFTLEEMRSGLAWETLIPHTVKGLGSLDGLTDQQRVIEFYKLMHKSGKMFRGGSMKGHTEAVADLVSKYQPASLLDYGSGKGVQYDELNLHERWGGLKPHCYDPGYPPIAEKPKGKFDGVLCTDVAEHVPEDAVDAFLADVIGYANRFAFFCIFTNPSRKFLPDGRNVHLTVRPPEWWVERIAAVTKGQKTGEYAVRKVLPGGAFEDFPHHVIRHSDKPVDVVVTFRGGDE